MMGGAPEGSLLQSSGGFGLEIECEKSVLRPLNRERASANYCDWLNDETVNQYSQRLDRRSTPEDVQAYIDRANTSTDTLLFGIFDRATGAHIGNIQLRYYDKSNGLADLSTLIGERDFWGKGYAKDVWKHIVHFGFSVVAVRKFTMGNSAGNKAASGKTLFVGARLEATKRRHVLIGGDYHDVLEYGLFPEDFYATFPALEHTPGFTRLENSDA
jgi:[ribosomal protein S5]-alanine N-acetyltransferase